MELKNFKLGVGPMSVNLVDLCLEYSSLHNFPIMFIPSRNQVDAKSGYAFTTSRMVKHIKNSQYYDSKRVLLCRDHCGPYFSDNDKNLTLQDALTRCYQTIDEDILCGFDLLHIDVSRVNQEDQYHVADILFNRAISQNNNIMFEFGTEDNTGTGLEESMQKLQQQLNFVEKFKPNIKFIVSQTGSLTKHTQVGTFNVIENRKTADLIHDSGLLFKEHNADYLNVSGVKERKKAGVDAINIAPELGSIQSRVILKFKDHFQDSVSEFYNDVLNAQYWKKWVTEDIEDLDIKFISSAHYCFNYESGKKLLSQLINQNTGFMDALRQELFNSLDQYRMGYES